MAEGTDYAVLEAAARDIVDEINRCIRLGEVPQLRQIRWWGGHLAVALEADQIRAKSDADEGVCPRCGRVRSICEASYGG